MQESSRPPSLGLSLTVTTQLPFDAVVELARQADALGYESLWVPETWGTDAVSLLAVLARETQHIRLAAGVLNVFSRSPALIAQTAATLQELSNGRFILGLGTSGPIVVQDWHGMPYDRPLQRTREYVEIVRKALAGERVDYEGELFNLRGFKLLNPPSSPVPIYIAALGPRNVHLTGEIADGWLPIFAARGHMQPLFDRLAEGAHVAGRQPASISVAAFIPALLGDRSGQLLARQIAYYVGDMGTFYAESLARSGFADEVADVRRRWESGDRRGAANQVSRALLDACTLRGTPGEIRGMIAQYHGEGIQVPVLTLPHGSTRDEAAATLEALSPGVRSSA